MATEQCIWCGDFHREACREEANANAQLLAWAKESMTPRRGQTAGGDA